MVEKKNIEADVEEIKDNIAEKIEEVKETIEEKIEEATAECEDAEDSAECGENFEAAYEEAKECIHDVADSIPTDEIKQAFADTAGKIKKGLLEHGINTDVMGAKLVEDAGVVAGFFAEIIATGADAIAKTAANVAENMRGEEEVDDTIGWRAATNAAAEKEKDAAE